MSDGDNNPSQVNPSNPTQQSFNSSLTGNSYGPASSGLNYGNGYSGYGGTSSYNSYMDDSYGSRMNSSYGGYSGYSSGYGGYGYNRGYSGYGSQYSNQYSNQYSKPLPQNAQNEQPPPPNFRHDVWGFLNGFHAMLNVLYAATGIVHFGKIFMRMSLKLIKLVCGKSVGLVFKLTGFKFLKDILAKLSTSDNWSSEFNFGDQPFENAWGNDSRNPNSTIFGKILLVLRVCSLLGTMFALFLRSKMKNQHPPVQVETVGPESFLNEIPQISQKPADFEKVKSFYDEIKLIEDEQQFLNHNNLPQISNKSQDQEAETFVQVFEDAQAALEELAPESEAIKVICESNEDKYLNLAESNDLTKKVEAIIDEAKEVETNNQNNQEQQPTPVVLEKMEAYLSNGLIPEKIIEAAKSETPIDQETTPSTNSSSISKDTIVSEDFWKNEVTYKAIENIQKEEKAKPEEIKKKEFELPSVLQVLRSSSTSTSNKPWLMKKKKAVEVPIEVPQQVQNNPAETLEKISETPETSEIKAENALEIPQVLEVPEVKLEDCAENLEGTNV